MFLKNQKENLKNEYALLLRSIGALSNLFADTEVPYLYYRAHENIFCEALEAENLSRSDCSADAKKGTVGIGLKTFLNNNGRTFQKVAEFNKERILYIKYIDDKKEFIKRIAQLRNKRIESTKTIHGIKDMIYHCVAREKEKFIIFEEKMDLIDIEKIQINKESKNTIHFTDGKNEYNFNISKSTLSKRFHTFPEKEIDVKILENAFDTLKIIYESFKEKTNKVEKKEYVILPLYSLRTGKPEEKSGLNQWNAGGRKRDPREVYIPVPAWIHKKFPNFFPDVSKNFTLHLPNGEKLNSKMCQTQKLKVNGEIINKGKGLMSSPNKTLGKWILEDILQTKEKELVTYEMLEELGIDSIEIRKIDDLNYEIDFKKLGSFQEFYDELEN